jgi:hypothetical protein
MRVYKHNSDSKWNYAFIIIILLLYRVIKSCSTVPKEVAGRSFGAENVNEVFTDTPQDSNYDMFTLLSPLLL